MAKISNHLVKRKCELAYLKNKGDYLGDYPVYCKNSLGPRDKYIEHLCITSYSYWPGHSRLDVSTDIEQMDSCVHKKKI